MKLKKQVLANASALATAVLWTICSLVVMVLPGFSLAVTKWWLHGLSIKALGAWNLNFNNFLLGGASLTAAGWVSGWIFGWAWEKASGK